MGTTYNLNDKSSRELKASYNKQWILKLKLPAFT